MLKVSLHFAKLDAVSEGNLIGKMDIAYEKLQAMASYKAALFAAGVGALPIEKLHDYPRWSASIWDLVVRFICLTFFKKEQLSQDDFSGRKGAFMQDLCAVVEHWPDGREVGISRIATAHVGMQSRRCNYVAHFWDDITGELSAGPFVHAPPHLNAWDLLARAYAYAATESFVLSERPELHKPEDVVHGGRNYVQIESLPSTLLAGIKRWLVKANIAPSSIDGIEGSFVERATFDYFLGSVV